MTFHSFTAADLHGGRTIGEELRLIFKGFSARLTASRRYRTVRAELLDYSPQQLAELGIRKADVNFIAEDAAGR